MTGRNALIKVNAEGMEMLKLLVDTTLKSQGIQALGLANQATNAMCSFSQEEEQAEIEKHKKESEEIVGEAVACEEEPKKDLPTKNNK